MIYEYFFAALCLLYFGGLSFLFASKKLSNASKFGLFLLFTMFAAPLGYVLLLAAVWSQV